MSPKKTQQYEGLACCRPCAVQRIARLDHVPAPGRLSAPELGGSSPNERCRTHPLPAKMAAKAGSWIKCGNPIALLTQSGTAPSLSGAGAGVECGSQNVSAAAEGCSD